VTAAVRLAKPPALARVLERVTETVRANQMLASGDTVLLSVSGGPDSVCLAEVMVRLRRLFKVRLEVFHLDHRLRPRSGADAVYVRRLADRLGLPFHLRVASGRPEAGESVEAWARSQRMYAAADVADRTGANRIAQGHTLDDQAETVLIALVRGGGIEALSGIAPVVGQKIQPLLDVTRDEVTTACRSLRLRPREDPTNQDIGLLRNAIRLIGLPALESATDRDLRATIARAADHLRIDERELSAQARAAADIVVTDAAGGGVLTADALRALPEAIRTRVARLALYRLGIVPTNADIDAVLDLASGRPGRRRDLTEAAVGLRTSTGVELRRTV
jgi:tRNA(Ile)-lysidine synthase